MHTSKQERQTNVRLTMANHSSGNTIHPTPSVEEKMAFLPSVKEANHRNKSGEESLSLLDLPATLDENTKTIRRDAGDSNRPKEYLSNSGVESDPIRWQ